MKKSILHASTATMLCLSAVAANAQVVDPGVIDRKARDIVVPERFDLNNEKEAPISDHLSEKEAQNPDEVFAVIQKINFSGVTKVEEPMLQVIASPYIDRPLTNRDLAELKYKIAREYYRRNFTLVKAATPAQDVNDGILDIQIIEARVDDVKIVQNDGVLKDYVAQAFAKRIKEGSVFNEQSSESLVSDLNDIKNVSASINLSPGDEFATTDVDVYIEEADQDENYVFFDNYGSEFTGEYVGRLHLEKSNFFNLGERVYLDARASNEDLYGAGIGFDIPTGFRNVIFHTNYHYTRNDVGEGFEVAGLEGESEFLDISLSSAPLNTRDERIDVKVGIESRRHESTANPNDTTQWEDNVRQAYVDASYLYRGDSTVWYGAVRVSKGLDTFGASEKNTVAQPSEQARSRAVGEPDAVIVRPTAYISHRPQLPYLENGTLDVIATAQLASNPLLSSDLFVIGGYGSVRGFEPALLTGEAGYSVNVEYLYDLPINPEWQTGFGPWYDLGVVFNRIGAPNNGNADRELMAAGLGFEAVGEIIAAGDTKLRLDWAYPLGHYDTPGIDDSTFYFRVSQYF